ncbi:glycosyltransferase family 4 protein [Nonomuraea sp. NPDC046570]|uniref:glycosyltransferase family 4 protein n=1 Tax=Nonomuraea sp. NPDC046570 TaxID=3155255 RepID=UPI0033E0A59A
MRVAFVLGTTSGGTGRHVGMLVEGLVRRGHQVVVAGPPSVGHAFRYAATGARFTPIPVSDRPHPVNDARAVAAIRRIARGADVVHAHGLRAGALAGLTGTRTPLIVTLHNALTAGGFVGAVHAALERVVANRAHTVLVVSPDLGERMRALGARRVQAAVVPAPVLRPAHRPPAEVRAELDAGQRPILLTIARLAQQKGLETLLDVSAAPLPRSPLFVVAGDGPLRAGLQTRIERERLPVVLLGNRDDIPDLLAAADAVLWPSRWEGQPLSLSEALAAGRPVIATEVGGIPGLLGGAGVLVPYGDVGAMRRAVHEVLEEPGEAARLAEAAVRRGAELPRADDAVEAVVGVYLSSAGVED